MAPQRRIMASMSHRIACDRDCQGEAVRDHGLHPLLPILLAEAGQGGFPIKAWSPKPEHVVTTLGAHAGDEHHHRHDRARGPYRLRTRHLFSNQPRRIAFRRRISIVDIDADGIIPDEFERICAQQHPKIVFLMPAVKIQPAQHSRLSAARRSSRSPIATMSGSSKTISTVR